MRRLFEIWNKPVLDEAGRWSVRVALLAIDEDFENIVQDVARVATADNRARVLELARQPHAPDA